MLTNSNRQRMVNRTNATDKTYRTYAADRTNLSHKSYSSHTSYCCLHVAFVLAITLPLSAQDAAPKSPARTFVGAAECVKCHLNGLPKGTDTALAADAVASRWVARIVVCAWVRRAAEALLQAVGSCFA